MEILTRLAWYGLGLLLLAFSLMVLAVGLVQPARAQAPAGSATLVIHVQGTTPEGILRLGLYDAARYAADDAPALTSADVPAQAGRTTVTFNNLAPGIYAIQSYQGRNGNGKMDTSWLGLPQEPYGFSRDARPRLSKPGFDRVRFAVAAGQNEQVFALQNTATR